MRDVVRIWFDADIPGHTRCAVHDAVFPRGEICNGCLADQRAELVEAARQFERPDYWKPTSYGPDGRMDLALFCEHHRQIFLADEACTACLQEDIGDEDEGDDE